MSKVSQQYFWLKKAFLWICFGEADLSDNKKPLILAFFDKVATNPRGLDVLMYNW